MGLKGHYGPFSRRYHKLDHDLCLFRREKKPCNQGEIRKMEGLLVLIPISSLVLTNLTISV